jgi:uncharacterized membrane protein
MLYTMLTDSITHGPDPIWNVLIRFSINLVVLYIVIRLIYFRYSKKQGYAFSFFLMGIMIFLVCILLKSVEIQLGMALGLFAIFAILRFRSRNLPLRDMTYFFTVLGIAVINAMASFYNPLRGTVLINSIIIISLIVLEFFFQKKKKEPLSKHRLLYDKLELLNPERKQDLLQDISLRTGIQIKRARIRKIDLTKGNAELEVFYKEKDKLNDSLP